ncbi:hypothetical protein [Sphingomonas faeni]|uniref:hypothetical protein n=1 Tax=Sphingomonas faeni TaxID=185950 RepID=UPI00335E3836
MSKTRQKAADELTLAFMPLERDADRVAANASRCVAIAMEAATKARLGPTRSNAAIELMLKAAAASAEARRLVREAHVALADIRDEVGLVSSYGDCDEGQKVFGIPLLSAVA